jgi:flavin reductase (DIM6/NTAB) family NADH-FMN oxidoreductase RutF
VDAARFRTLLGRFATGVTVLTTRTPPPERRPHGMTASAVASVSLDPPLVAVCVDQRHDIHAAIEVARRFALNVLAAEQEALSRRFAGNDPDRFAGVAYHDGADGLPLLEGVVAHIECDRHDAVRAGDHTLFIGRVTGGETADRPPLLHYRGGYTQLRTS